MGSKGSKSVDITSVQSLWHDQRRKVWCFLCPHCETQRQIPFRPQPGGFQHFFQVGLTTVFFMLVTWRWLHWKGFVFFLPFWTTFEIIYRWRARGVIRCSLCGFDPYLFLVNENWAKREIETHWRKKFAERGIPYPGEPEQTTPSEQPPQGVLPVRIDLTEPLKKR